MEKVICYSLFFVWILFSCSNKSKHAVPTTFESIRDSLQYLGFMQQKGAQRDFGFIKNDSIAYYEKVGNFEYCRYHYFPKKQIRLTYWKKNHSLKYLLRFDFKNQEEKKRFHQIKAGLLRMLYHDKRNPFIKHHEKYEELLLSEMP